MGSRQRVARRGRGGRPGLALWCRHLEAHIFTDGYIRTCGGDFGERRCVYQSALLGKINRIVSRSLTV